MAPQTQNSVDYLANRSAATNEARARLKLDKELRASMDWLRKLRHEVADANKAKQELEPLDVRLNREPPPKEVLSALGVETLDGMYTLMRRHHSNAAQDRLEVSSATSTNTSAPWRVPTVAELLDVLEGNVVAHRAIAALYARTDLDEADKLSEIQHVVLRHTRTPTGAGLALGDKGGLPDLATACDEIEELLEMMGEGLMKRMGGMEPKEISSLGGFINRLIEAIQMTNDERVQTKENYSRTCTLHTEYVDTMSFRLEEADNEFLWRKGYLSTKMWLDKRSEKAKEKRKKVASSIAKTLMGKVQQRASGAQSALALPPADGVSADPTQGRLTADGSATLTAMAVS